MPVTTLMPLLHHRRPRATRTTTGLKHIHATGEVMENQPMLDLLWRVRFRWKLRVRQVTGDTKYGTIPNIRAVEDMGIRAYVPLPDWEQISAAPAPSGFTVRRAQRLDARSGPAAGGGVSRPWASFCRPGLCTSIP